MKKLSMSLVLLFLALTLMPGLWGCVDKRKDSGTCPATQPRSASCAESKTTVAQADDAAVEDEAVEVENRHPVRQELDRQIYNAELADMYVSDIHFLPNRCALNGTGTQRLSHLAWLVDKYGGAINLDLSNPNSQLARERFEIVQKFLRAYGLPESKIQICTGLPQGQGMDAKEAIVIHNDTRFKPQKEGRGDSIIFNGK